MRESSDAHLGLGYVMSGPEFQLSARPVVVKLVGTSKGGSASVA